MSFRRSNRSAVIQALAERKERQLQEEINRIRDKESLERGLLADSYTCDSASYLSPALSTDSYRDDDEENTITNEPTLTCGIRFSPVNNSERNHSDTESLSIGKVQHANTVAATAITPLVQSITSYRSVSALTPFAKTIQLLSKAKYGQMETGDALLMIGNSSYPIHHGDTLDSIITTNNNETCSMEEEVNINLAVDVFTRDNDQPVRTTT